jgi:hypothetical protein
MVQVDIFWSYAFGAGFAAAASRQLAAKAKEAAEQGRVESLLENRYFAITVIYLAALFAPSGIGLLWAFPSWETMHAGDRDLPTWLVLLFAITNITQGMLGFWVTRRLLLAGKTFLAALQMPIGYFGMFFILVHGWDGTGYRRFLSANKEALANWKLSSIPHFLISDVALTLYGMGIVLLPVMFALMSRWILQGQGEGTCAQEHCPWRVSRKIARVILGGSLGLAIIASILVHLLGWLGGALVFAAVAYFLVWREKAILRSWLAEMLLQETSAQKAQYKMPMGG